MASNSFDVEALLGPEQIASEIANKWVQWAADRDSWVEDVIERRNYLYALDTRTTTNNKVGFKNSTTVPKLSQIQQNLKANYMSHMFGNPKWLNWESSSHTEDLVAKRRAIEAYMRIKMREGGSMDELDKCIDDWTEVGEAYARLVFMSESHVDELDNLVPGYTGFKIERIPYHDIVYNIAATSWERSPKIIRSLLSLGELARMVDEQPDDAGWASDIMADVGGRREKVRASSQQIHKSDTNRSRAFIADGFASITEYYNSDLVEVLEFYGDWYDISTGEFLKNHVITVVDRVKVIRREPVKNWQGRPYLYKVNWRDRPDNLMGAGPLDQLVGMQYKIDKLENLRADVFDQIAQPTTVEIGTVEFFGVEGAPGGRYVVDEGGQVQHLRPDSTALTADLQINQTMQLMEELAGAPREAMGLRSPGEKTKFEVQVLDNGSNRLFRNKVRKFETQFLEVILNDALELSRRNLDGKDIIRMQDETFGVDQFLTITKEDITATGKLFAKGSLHFEKQANAIQNLNMIFNSQLGQIINPHLSRTKLARIVEDLLSAEQFDLFGDNVGVLEDINTQRIAQSGAEQLQEESLTDGSLEGEQGELPLGE